jgi:hypothetical protein
MTEKEAEAAMTKVVKPGPRTTEFYALILTNLIVAVLITRFAFFSPFEPVLSVAVFVVVGAAINGLYMYLRVKLKMYFLDYVVVNTETKDSEPGGPVRR